MNRKQHKHPEDLPSDDELEAMEDKDGTDIVDPAKFKKMQKEIDDAAEMIVERLIVNNQPINTGKGGTTPTNRVGK